MAVVDIFFCIEQVFHDLALQYSLLKNFVAVLRLYLHVLDCFVSALDPNQGPQFTDALTAGSLYANARFVLVMRCKFQGYAIRVTGEISENIMDFCGTGGDTAGAGTDKNPAVLERNGLFRSFPDLS